MSLVTGRIAEIYVEGGTTKAKVSVLMTLLTDARVGDDVLVDSGVLLSTVQQIQTKEVGHVLGDSR